MSQPASGGKSNSKVFIGVAAVVVVGALVCGAIWLGSQDPVEGPSRIGLPELAGLVVPALVLLLGVRHVVTQFQEARTSIRKRQPKSGLSLTAQGVVFLCLIVPAFLLAGLFAIGGMGLFAFYSAGAVVLFLLMGVAMLILGDTVKSTQPLPPAPGEEPPRRWEA